MTDQSGREVIISVRGLAKSFGTHQIWDSLSLDVYRGEILAIVGGSGQGKSVLMRVITGLLKPDKGDVGLFGQDTKTLSPDARLDIEKRWGILFQDGALFSALTVLQNIQVPMREHLDLPQPMMDDLAFLKLTMVGLPPEAAHKLPSELSGGMRKRAGLARALALDPEIVFLDEPTAGLDPIGASDFDHLIRKLQQTLGLTVYMVTMTLIPSSRYATGWRSWPRRRSCGRARLASCRANPIIRGSRNISAASVLVPRARPTSGG